MAANPTYPIRVPLQSPSSSSCETATSSAPSTPGQSSSDEYTATIYDNELDADKDPRFPVPGYPRLTKLIVDYPGFEAFQSFRDLNIKSLLYYQAELAELRLRLHELEYRDYREKPFPGAGKCFRTFEKISEGRTSDNENARMQYDKIKRIREVLKEYSAYMDYTGTVSRSFSTNQSICDRCCPTPIFEDLRPPGSRKFQRQQSLQMATRVPRG
jgi:Family of unknown function (DUF6594)